MRVTLTHISAAYQWLMTPMDGRELEGLPRHGTMGSCPESVRDFDRLDLHEYLVEGLETELLTTSARYRPRLESYRYHVASAPHPPGAFVVLTPDVQIVSPELSFWQMAKILPLGELVKYGDALCGKYSYTVDADGRPLKREEPLTDLRRLEDFALAMGRPTGNLNAFRALKCIVEGSESPMESCTTILLCLKRQYGGFGFIRPVMGYVVDLDEVGRGLTGTEKCRCDMYWPHANYDLEYDSDQEHGPDAVTHDSLRRTAIRHMGITVGEMRKVQVLDPATFDASARMLAGELGIKIMRRSPALEYKYSLASTDLRHQLFWWERRKVGMDPNPLHVADLDW